RGSIAFLNRGVVLARERGLERRDLLALAFHELLELVDALIDARRRARLRPLQPIDLRLQLIDLRAEARGAVALDIALLLQARPGGAGRVERGLHLLERRARRRRVRLLGVDRP